MRVTVKVKKEIDVKTVLVKAGVRYWEDGEVNGIDDSEGDLIPCRKGDLWCPEIDIETGTILNWEEGKEANVNYKVCDNGSYYLKDSEGNIVWSREDNYVPNALIPGTYGDYIKMKINKEGVIKNWDVSELQDLLDEEED